MKVYMIVLVGQGDTDVRIVDEATFDWVSSKDMGKPKGHPENKNSWADQLVPEAQKALRATDGQEEDVCLTSGSWWNDRMLAALSLERYANENMWSIRDANKAVKKHGDEVEDTIEGMIY